MLKLSETWIFIQNKQSIQLMNTSYNEIIFSSTKNKQIYFKHSKY